MNGRRAACTRMLIIVPGPSVSTLIYLPVHIRCEVLDLLPSSPRVAPLGMAWLYFRTAVKVGTRRSCDVTGKQYQEGSEVDDSMRLTSRMSGMDVTRQLIAISNLAHTS